MRNECNIIRDLLPLYAEKMVSDDTADFVEEHLQACPDCRKALAQINEPQKPVWEPKQEVNPFEAFMKRIRKKTRMVSGLLMMLGIFCGLGLTAGSEMFYNSLLMPVIGGLGYFLFRWRAAYVVPLLLTAAGILTALFNKIRGLETLDLLSLLNWIGIYVLFVFLGILIAWLLHFALHGRDDR